MGLFSDIYNTVAKFFRPQEEQGDTSKSVAQNRLKLVLMQDRTNLTPRVLEQMRSEMIELLSKYVEMDKELLELNFEQEGDQVALMLSIPVIRAKEEDEIEEALKAEETSETEERSDEIEENSECENSDTENCECEHYDENCECNYEQHEECSCECGEEDTSQLVSKPKRGRKPKVSEEEKEECSSEA